MPAAHEVQFAAEPAPTSAEAVPAGQLVHTVEPAVANWPAAHCKHDAAPSAALYPAGQALQTVSLETVQAAVGALPAAHTVQVVQAETPPGE